MNKTAEGVYTANEENATAPVAFHTNSDGKITSIVWNHAVFTGTSDNALPDAGITLTTVTAGSEYSFAIPALNVTVSAAFEEAPTYTAAFDANGGTGTMADVTELSGEWTLPECGFTAPEGKMFNQWEITQAGSSSSSSGSLSLGTVTAPVNKKPGETYEITSNITVKAQWIDKTAAVITKNPTGNILTYTGSAQELVTAGEADGGTMQYALGTDAATVPTARWSTDIPVAANAGTYHVWYKAVGDENHIDSEAAHVAVTIGRKTITVKAESKEKMVGASDPAFTYTVESLVEGDREEDVLTGELSRMNGEEAGTYDITQGTLAIKEAYADRYILDFTGAVFTIHASTAESTNIPAAEPTAAPIVAPTAAPTAAPTVAPIVAPTAAPTVAPMAAPIVAPTVAPTVAPMAAPTAVPTSKPATSQATAKSVAAKEKAALSLNAGLKVIHKGKMATVEWGKVSGAAYYKVYAGYCGSTYELAKKVTAGKKCKIMIKKLKGKKLSTKKNIKVYVAAYKTVNGKAVQMAKSIDGHVVGKENVKYSNAKKIKLSKTSYTLKKEKSVIISAKTIFQYPDRSQLSDAHAKEFRYATTDKSVAVVSKSGKITAKGTGECVIFVYARNGLAKKIEVTVK